MVASLENTRTSAAAPYRYAFVSTSAEIGEAIRGHVDPHIESLTVKPAAMEAAVPIARQLLEEGVEVVIGGGGTGSVLMQTIGQSVVKVERDAVDVMRALLTLRSRTTHIVLACFQSVPDGFDVYRDLVGIRVTPVVFTTLPQLESGVRTAAAQGAQIVVGDGVCRKVAAKVGIEALVVLPRDTAIRQALNEARAVAASRRRERGDLQELRTILASSRDGIAVVDTSRRLKFVNDAAIQIFRPLLSAGTISPNAELQATLEAAGVYSALATGQASIDRVKRVGPLDLVVSSVPIQLDGRTVGVVGTIREAQRIQNIDRKLREKLYEKGFVARYRFDHIKGAAPAMQALVERAKRFARSDASVMIEGETGTGKELLAQSIHNASVRSEKPFVAINCSALSDSLLESELFGYEEGAFTGARKGGKIGLIELAQGGTLFLDEIADISTALQLRLLRVLEEKEIMRLGGDRMVPVDVRIISSSQRPLSARSAGFRGDLYYRLATLKLRIPPLREREDDIPAILIALFEKHGRPVARLPAKVITALQRHSWPGNLRELDSLVRTYIALEDREAFSEAVFLDVLAEIVQTSADNVSDGSTDAMTLKQQVRAFERQLISEALRVCGFDRDKAALRLGISKNSLWRKSRDG